MQRLRLVLSAILLVFVAALTAQSSDGNAANTSVAQLFADTNTTVIPGDGNNNPVLVLLQSVVNVTANFKKSLNATIPIDPAPTLSNTTDFGLLRSSGVGPVTVWPALVAGACIGLGLAVLFYGYKLFRPTVFLLSFAFGAMVGYMTAERVYSPTSGSFYIVCWSVFAVCGLLCGFVGLYVLSVGVMLVGGTGGVVLAFLLTTSFGHKWWPTYPDGVLFILMGVLALTFAILCYTVEKPMLVPMMALTGAGAAVWGVGYFAGGYANADDLSVYRTSNAFGAVSFAIPNSYWIYLCATILLALVGTFIQFMNTACCENNALYTWETHGDIEMEVRRTTYNQQPRRYEGYGYGRGVRTRDNYYHRHDHRQGPY
ncbi:hypothetical protein DYB32_008430 [Aphanomyces invadans]|uniref:Transmembrane protein 198 n=1 Tax=Aphanomyces invadans TaxID=157072 RepID=A0A3R6Y3A5_9STRA|nr:hypothetical protein DYB32_008430 [Aphanomyces invadans]